jgi:protein-S-isoprenylcysteine O-methyltransferase Ste14
MLGFLIAFWSVDSNWPPAAGGDGRLYADRQVAESDPARFFGDACREYRKRASTFILWRRRGRSGQ